MTATFLPMGRVDPGLVFSNRPVEPDMIGE